MGMMQDWACVTVGAADWQIHLCDVEANKSEHRKSISEMWWLLRDVKQHIIVEVTKSCISGLKRLWWISNTLRWCTQQIKPIHRPLDASEIRKYAYFCSSFRCSLCPSAWWTDSFCMSVVWETDTRGAGKGEEFSELSRLLIPASS